MTWNTKKPITLENEEKKKDKSTVLCHIILPNISFLKLAKIVGHIQQILTIINIKQKRWILQTIMK